VAYFLLGQPVRYQFCQRIIKNVWLGKAMACVLPSAWEHPL